MRRGYSDRAIELILGGNFQRVLGEIWGAQGAIRTGVPTGTAS